VRSRPGKLFEVSGRLFLGAADGCLEILELQPDGKKALPAQDFLNGLRGAGKATGELVWDLAPG
jgi:methionyl-tRNA formyltransferase